MPPAGPLVARCDGLAGLGRAVVLALLTACSTGTAMSEPTAEYALVDGGACPAVARDTCVAPSYERDIVPILDGHCNGCHSATVDGGPWPLGGYENVADWRNFLLSDLLDCAAEGVAVRHVMPPPEAGAPLATSDRDTVVKWLLCGAPNN